MIIRNMLPEDWQKVKEIYEKGIATGNATFQTEAPVWADWDSGHLASCRLIAEKDSEILGWAALSPVSSRCVYAGVAEVSVYVDPAYSCQGIGKALLRQLVLESENQGIWTLQAGIFPENLASVKLHQQSGFREIGFREKIGIMNGTWRNTLLLERRSANIF
jgi:L-amino acid N-acyltransferase YncA